MTDADQQYAQEIEAARQVREQQDQIAETRPGHTGETYIPNTPWRRQDTSPHPVPEKDADGGPWRITGQGLHVGSHNGQDYCLEWLPTELLPDERIMPPDKSDPGAPPAAEAEEDLRRQREAGQERREEPARRIGPRLGADVDQPEFGPDASANDQGLEAW